MIPQILVFGVYRLPLNLLLSILNTLGLKYNTQLLMEFGIVLYQYITVSFLIGAFFGIFNLFLFFIVRYLVSLIDGIFRFDTNCFFTWLNVEERLKEDEKFKGNETFIVNKNTTKSQLDETLNNEQESNKNRQDKENNKINSNQEKEQENKGDKIKYSTLSPLVQPTPPRLPERLIDTKTDIELMPNTIKTSTTQTCKYKDEKNVSRARLPHSSKSTEESIVSDSLKNDDNASQTADTSFQTEEPKLY